MKIFRKLAFIYIVICCYSSPSMGEVVLNVENGLLKGATGININGSRYDVTFQDGTCSDIFSGCDELSDFFFPVPDSSVDLTLTDAYFASQALLDQVFIDSNLGLFDSDPTLTFGCNGFALCNILNPISNNVTNDLFNAIFASNNSLDSLDFIGSKAGTSIFADQSELDPNVHNDIYVFAVWSHSAVVPLPAAAWLFLSGLIGLIGFARKSSCTQCS